MGQPKKQAPAVEPYRPEDAEKLLSELSGKAASMEAKLMALKGLTLHTGGLHELQVMHLRRWGLLAGGPRSKVTLKLDLPERSVIFEVVAPKPAKPKAVELLKRSVGWLLGDDWTVTFRRVRG